MEVEVTFFTDMAVNPSLCINENMDVIGAIGIGKVLVMKITQAKKDRHQQDLNLRPQRGTDISFESVAVTTWL